MARFLPRTLLAFSSVTLFVDPGFSESVIADAAPDQISGLGLWLAAADLARDHTDGASVTRWPDRSGKGYDAVFEGRIPQARLQTGFHQAPTFEANALDGQPAVAFDADKRQTLILNRAGHALGQGVSGFTAIFLVRAALAYGPAPAQGIEWSEDRYLFITHVSNYDTRISVKVMQGTGEVQLRSRAVPGEKIQQSSSFSNGKRAALGRGAWHRLMVTVDYRAKQSRIVIDGSAFVHQIPAATADAFEDVPSPIAGIGSNTLGDWITCELAEVACYGKALTADELHSVDAYLCNKYGLSR